MAISLSSVPRVLARIASARTITFGAYTLSPKGVAYPALLEAARRGAHVAVTLQADPYRNPHGAADNARVARELRRAGAEVTLLPSDRAPFHLKAAACDGVAYLDDRNWTKRGPEVVLADDDPHDVKLVRDALAGRGGGANGRLALRKDEALRRECALVERAGAQPVIVETERVATSPITRALEQRALAGEPTTLIVAPATRHSRTEAKAMEQLARDGVTVLIGGRNEKLALAGRAAWIGSPNATGASGRSARQAEWGTVTRARALVAAVRASLGRDASAAARYDATCGAPSPAAARSGAARAARA